MKDGKKILAAMRRKRGYVLGYHRLMAADPELLAAYDAFYSRMTLASRALGNVEKETIWIALIIATRAKVGTLHFERARKAGMSREAITDAVEIGAACETWDALAFSASHFKSKNRYLKFFKSTRLVHIAAAVAQAGRRCPEAMALHLEQAFRAGAKREQVAEALSYCLLHCGGPTMVEAVDCWLRTARRKRFPAPF
jgi:alkylhydroperoxidase/carboxymuconolactone decarboxylase family protein YurZ